MIKLFPPNLAIIRSCKDNTNIKAHKKGLKTKGVKIEPVIVPTMTTPRSLNAKSDLLIQNTAAKKEFENFLQGKGKVTQSEYKDIIKNHISTLIHSMKYVDELKEFKFFKTPPELSAKLAILAKKRLESLFGKDEYKLISIGTSPSFITEAMKELGVDTIFLPISNAGYISADFSLEENLLKHPNLIRVAEYLKTKGITPENTDKKIVILDYSNRGRTLNLVRDIIKRYCKIPSDKIDKLNMADLLHGIRGNYSAEQQGKDGIVFDPDLVLDEIDFQKVECMSNTPHYSVYDERYNEKFPFSVTSKGKTDEELFREFEDFSKPSARAYQLCVLHELNKLKGGIND